ncbi:cation:proton antiporter [Alistipes sp.]|uniref:cation:proton antiporter domain-containing protein n=1 Tax=Alistipes sp. TaxID=1872444 RepID=UPI001D78B4D2|nr:cation:proton antiporter [Alistipes sp.]MBS1413780.1 sodium:proton antiporter [Alistipes sp.]
MTHLDPIISDLALILAVAGVTTLLFKWLKQPVVLGYIVAGFLCSGNFLLQGVSNMGNVDIWAEIGIIFLLFSLGLEFSFKKLMNVGGPALMTALVVIVGMMCSGFMAGRALGWTSTDSIFLGGMLSMSSTTIIIKAFDDLGLRSQKFTSLVFGVLVVEDLFAVVLMVMLSTLFVQRAVEHVVIAEQLFKLIFFLILWFVVGIYLIPTFLKKIRKFLNQETLLVISLGLCLIMVVLATYAGFSSALGAFIMGSILAGTVQAESIEKVIAPVKDLFGAVFFVSVGMLVEPAMLVQYIVPIVFLTVVVIVGQIFYGTLGFLVSGQNLKIALQSSFSLAQIGEFAFIIASLGLSMGVTSSFLYPVAVAVSVVTTFTTPFIIRLSDPAYHRINRLIPKRMKALLARYSAGSQTVNSEREWMSLLKKSLLNMFIYCVLLGGVVWISSSYYSPFVEERFEGFAGKLIATTTTILFMTPLLWGLAVRHLNRRLFVPLWNDPRFNHGLLVSLIVLRILLALMFVLTVVAHLSSYRWGALMAFAILLFLLALFWRRIKRGYLRFEQRFFTNLNEKDASTVVTTGNYRAKFLHMAKMTVSADSPLVGRCFRELDLRLRYGVTVVSVLRGSHRYNAPGASMVLMPSDEISVVGTDAQLSQFASKVEVPLSPVDREEATMQKFSVGEHSVLIGMTVSQFGMMCRGACLIIGIERSDGSYVRPLGLVRFQPYDMVWIAGDRETIEQVLVGTKPPVPKTEKKLVRRILRKK